MSDTTIILFITALAQRFGLGTLASMPSDCIIAGPVSKASIEWSLQLSTTNSLSRYEYVPEFSFQQDWSPTHTNLYANLHGHFGHQRSIYNFVRHRQVIWLPNLASMTWPERITNKSKLDTKTWLQDLQNSHQTHVTSSGSWQLSTCNKRHNEFHRTTKESLFKQSIARSTIPPIHWVRILERELIWSSC